MSGIVGGNVGGLVLVSHKLCPYVQRAAIVLHEKGVPFEQRWVDLADKPAWLRAVSPLGKTPVLLVGDDPVFESAVICEYLDEVYAPRLHPSGPLERARHRAWMEFGSAVLNAVAGFYNAPDVTRSRSANRCAWARAKTTSDRSRTSSSNGAASCRSASERRREGQARESGERVSRRGTPCRLRPA